MQCIVKFKNSKTQTGEKGWDGVRANKVAWGNELWPVGIQWTAAHRWHEKEKEREKENYWPGLHQILTGPKTGVCYTNNSVISVFGWWQFHPLGVCVVSEPPLALSSPLTSWGFCALKNISNISHALCTHTLNITPRSWAFIASIQRCQLYQLAQVLSGTSLWHMCWCVKRETCHPPSESFPPKQPDHLALEAWWQEFWLLCLHSLPGLNLRVPIKSRRNKTWEWPGLCLCERGQNSDRVCVCCVWECARVCMSV